MCEENSATSCTNCKYYKRHYVVTDNAALRATCIGHCTNIKISDSASAEYVEKNEGCDLWQPQELQKLSIQYGIELRLQKIYDSVNELLVILRDTE